MTSFAHHRGDVEVSAPSDSVSALVALMQTELHSLMTRREELVARIRSLHHLMRGLREMASPSAFDCLRIESLSSSAALKTTSAPSPDDHTIANRLGRNLQSGERCKSSRASLGLRRACRIALMEAGTAASVEEIYARIVRRDSFSLANMECATAVLVQVLNAMTEQGEVRLVECGPGPRWERLPGAMEN